MRILVVEDERLLCDGIAEDLELEKYTVDRCYNGADAYERLFVEPYDLVILDLNLPGMDGLELLRRIRSERPELRVLILSARAQLSDKVAGLDLGADDYLTKPFALEELAARVQAHLRRQERSAPGRPAGGPIQIGAIRLDPEKLTVTKAGAPVALSTRELELLTYLMRHAGETLSRDRIFHDVWRTDYGDVGTVAINIKNLRSKLDPEWRYIKTVWGSGYRFVTQSGFAEEEAEKG